MHAANGIGNRFQHIVDELRIRLVLIGVIDHQRELGGRRLDVVHQVGGQPVDRVELLRFRESPVRVVECQKTGDLPGNELDEIAVFGLDPRSDGLFLTVVAYRDLGLFYEAREALEAVERQGPLSWELYRLKGEVLAELGRETEARAAFDRADELMR